MDITGDSFPVVNHREFLRRYLAFIETWMKLSCIGITLILFFIIVTNLIW